MTSSTNPTGDVVDLIRRAINDPGQFEPRADNYQEPVGSWAARAVVTAALPALRAQIETELRQEIADEIRVAGGVTSYEAAAQEAMRRHRVAFPLPERQQAFADSAELVRKGGQS